MSLGALGDSFVHQVSTVSRSVVRWIVLGFGLGSLMVAPLKFPVYRFCVLPNLMLGVVRAGRMSILRNHIRRGGQNKPYSERTVVLPVVWHFQLETADRVALPGNQILNTRAI